MKGAGGALVAVTAANWAGLSLGQDATTLRVAMAAAPTSLDPVYANQGANNPWSAYLFDPLVWRDAKSVSTPGLAVSWTPTDDTHWEFKLREGVKFSDGSDFSADDVIATINRVRSSDSVSSFQLYAKTIKTMTAPDPLTVVFETTAPDPLFHNSMSRIFVIPKSLETVPVADFDSGKSMVGTGAYIYDSYSPGAAMVMHANRQYWGRQSDWDKVVLSAITDSAARLAALLSGDVDLIESPPYEALERIDSNASTHVVSGVSGRIVLLSMDQYRDVSPYITDNNGQPLTANPLKDKRVRLALAKAIDRKAIVERVMSGYAVAASQFLPTGADGTAPGAEPIALDVDGARKLLADAGYPEGFQLTIHGPTDRDVNTPKIVQAIAQMFTRVGVRTAVQVMPWNVYATGIDTADYSMSINSWGVNTGETSNPMTSMVATFDHDTGFGPRNTGRYSNPDVDKLLKQALQTVDADKRNALLSQASRLVIDDTGVIFLHHEAVVVGAAKAVNYETRVDQYLLATNAGKAA